MENKKYFRVGNSGLYDLRTKRYRANANGCFRGILARQYIGQPVANEREEYTFKIGELCEVLVAKKWLKQDKKVEQNVEVIEHIKEDVYLMGHADAVVDGVLYEEKSIQSVNSFKKIYKGGLYKKDNLAQLVNYMLALEKTEAVLVYTIIGYFGDKSEPGQQREFKVRIDDDTGKIFVDNTEADFNVMEVLYHGNQAAECLHKRKIFPDRPETLDPPWIPCEGCWLKSMCDKWEENRDDEEFFTNVQKHLDIVGKRC